MITEVLLKRINISSILKITPLFLLRFYDILSTRIFPYGVFSEEFSLKQTERGI